MSAEAASAEPISMLWVETELEPSKTSDTFVDLVNAELDLMEETTQGFRERGGYYLIINPDGSARQEFPALASGERPLGQ